MPNKTECCKCGTARGGQFIGRNGCVDRKTREKICGKRDQPSASAERKDTAQPAAPRRPALRLTPEEPVKQYVPRKSETSTTNSIPRLDALLKEDSDEPYNIDDILAGLDRKRG